MQCSMIYYTVITVYCNYTVVAINKTNAKQKTKYIHLSVKIDENKSKYEL